jgi:hypothetical protein
MEVAFQPPDLVEVAHAYYRCHCTASALDDEVLAHFRIAHQPGEAAGRCLCHGDSMGLKRDQTHGAKYTGICTDIKGRLHATGVMRPVGCLRDDLEEPADEHGRRDDGDHDDDG